MKKRALLVSALLAATSCATEDATIAVVDNGYPTKITVFKVWWQTTVFVDAVAPGGEGTAERTVPATDTAYAILAPGWDPSSKTPPPVLLPAKSIAPFGTSRGETLHIVVSDATFAGNCAAGEPLTQPDADFITQRIFP